MPIKTYRRRPTDIEAVQWTGENAAEIADWVGTGPGRNGPISKFDDSMVFPGGKARLFVDANDGWRDIEVGEWVAKDVKGFYPIKADMFHAVYKDPDDKPSNDPVEVLNEIVKAVMDRMNDGNAINDWEAWTLGVIAGMAMRVDGVELPEDKQ